MNGMNIRIFVGISHRCVTLSYNDHGTFCNRGTK